VKLYLDENLSPRIAELLRARGLDVTSAHETGNTQLADSAQLRYATHQERAIVTCDVADFVALAA
jgi:predicted nuclease of predicted toxin-antitoxin system